MQRFTNSIRQSKKALLTVAVSVALGLGLIFTPAASALSIGGPSDCDSNAIVNCGVHSTAAVQSAYQGSAYIRAVYAYFGISQADVANLQATNVAGKVTKDGNVFIDGQSKAVATNAITGGRQNMPGSTMVNTQGAIFYKRPPSASFQQASLPAFVSMKNGQFQFAVIASCGNAVKATPTSQPQVGIGNAQAVSKPPAKSAAKPTPAAPAPAPAPTQSQSQFQAQSQSQTTNVTNTNTNTVNNTQTTQPAAETVAASQPAPAPAAQTQAAAAQPTSLVNTGPAGVVGVFLASSAAGVFIFRRFLTHRLSAE